MGTRPDDGDDLDLQAQVVPWSGLFGLRARRRQPVWELVPVLAGRPLGPRIRVGGPKAGGREAEAPRPTAAPGAGVGERLRGHAATLRLLLDPARRGLRALPSAIRLRRLSVDGTVGFEDPAATGRLCGLLSAIGPAVPRQVHLRVIPDFTRAGVCGRVEVRAHLHLARLLWILARFAVAGSVVWVGIRIRSWRSRSGRSARRGQENGSASSSRAASLR